MIRAALASLLILSGFLLSSTALADRSLRLMTNASPPYADVKLPEQGIAPELVRAVFDNAGYSVEISIENWSRAVEGARLGVYDGLAAAWYSEERAGSLLFSEPYLESELVILKRRADTRHYDSLSDLSGARLGVRTDYAYGVDFSSVPGLVLVRENHLIQNLLRLQNGSVDFVIGDLRTVNQQLHEYMKDSASKFTVTKIKLAPVARHVAISHLREDHKTVVADFNKALAALRADGTYDAILKKWRERYRGLN